MSQDKNAQPSSRVQRARSEMSHNRSSGTMRNEFRNEFFTRLRCNRSRSVDRFRQIVEDYGEIISYRSISDLRRVLEVDPEASNLMKDTEVNDVLNQIEQELAQVVLQDQGDRHELEKQSETEDIINRHLVLCSVCQSLSPDGAVCGQCTSLLQEEFTKSHPVKIVCDERYLKKRL